MSVHVPYKKITVIFDIMIISYELHLKVNFVKTI